MSSEINKEISKCPFHGEGIPQKHPSGKGQTNKDWWPNSLNLKILSQHSELVNPFDNKFDYKKEFKKLNYIALKNETGDAIAIAGDSAGGGATLATAISLRDDHGISPSCLYLIFPWLDLTHSGESMKIKAECSFASRRQIWCLLSAANRLFSDPRRLRT